MNSFETMALAVKFIEETLQIQELQYQYDSYAYGQKGNTRLIASWKDGEVIVQKIKLCPTNRQDALLTILNREIAKMAFCKLRKESITDSALRLANSLLFSESISLGIGDIDWEIELALNYCGAKPKIGIRQVAHFNFNGFTKLSQSHYENLTREFYD